MHKGRMLIFVNIMQNHKYDMSSSVNVRIYLRRLSVLCLDHPDFCLDGPKWTTAQSRGQILEIKKQIAHHGTIAITKSTDKTTEMFIFPLSQLFCSPPEIFSSVRHLLHLDQFAVPENNINILLTVVSVSD